MSGFYRFLKTTIIGGLIFLVPIIVILAILGKAFEIMAKVADPLSALIPIDTIGRIAVVNLLALILIVLVCFWAGLFARTQTASRLVQTLETKILSHIPVYAFIKGMAQSFTEGEVNKGMKAVLATLDDNAQIAFEIERLEGGHVAVYLPGAPNPWSGSVCIMSEDRVQPIEASMAVAVQNLRHLGRGSGELLKGKLGNP